MNLPTRPPELSSAGASGSGLSAMGAGVYPICGLCRRSDPPARTTRLPARHAELDASACFEANLGAAAAVDAPLGGVSLHLHLRPAGEIGLERFRGSHLRVGSAAS